MLNMINKLRALQEVDRIINGLQREARDIPNRKKECDSRLNRYRLAVQEAQEEIKRNDIAISRLEGEAKEYDQKINRLRQQQFQIKTNEDYRILEGEIEVCNRQKGEIEDQELALLEKKDGLKARLEQAQQVLNNEAKVVSQEVASLEERSKGAVAELATMQGRRQNLAEVVEAPVLSRYERIMQNKGDYALVAVEKGCCSGCHMHLPPSIIKGAKKGQELVVCNFCSRILYWQEEYESNFVRSR